MRLRYYGPSLRIESPDDHAFDEFKRLMNFLNPYNILPEEKDNWNEIVEQFYAEDKGWS